MGRVSYVAAVLADNPKAFWQCQDASGGAVDSIAGFDLNSEVGTPDYGQPGPMDDLSIRFVGGDGLRRAGPVSTVVQNLTMEMLVAPQAVGGTAQIYFYNGNAGANGWGIVTNEISNQFRYKVLCGGVAFLGNGSTPATNVFSHIVATRAASIWTYYLNGVVDNANAGTATPGAPSGSFTSIGTSNSFQLAMAYVAVYETSLSAGQVAAHYAAIGADDVTQVLSQLSPRIQGHTSF